ncbi:MAG: Asp/Glu/hydantoin racemase [Lachnospiraceae bacterium]|nr:Asp/Glu/hydantoin racemase [Lachnospiraceae bacterium]
MSKSIAIIQTSTISTADLTRLCNEILPGVKIYHIIDSSLLDEVVANNHPTSGVYSRMFQYYKNAQDLGVDAILNQCSSVSEVAEYMKQFIDVPIVKVDEAMARKAVSMADKIALVATAPSTLAPSHRLLDSAAAEAGKDVKITEYLSAGAMQVLLATGDKQKHNEMIIDTVRQAAAENDVVVLAQGSMLALEPMLSTIDKPVLTSPKLGVEYLKEVLDRA